MSICFEKNKGRIIVKSGFKIFYSEKKRKERKRFQVTEVVVFLKRVLREKETEEYGGKSFFFILCVWIYNNISSEEKWIKRVAACVVSSISFGSQLRVKTWPVPLHLPLARSPLFSLYPYICMYMSMVWSFGVLMIYLFCFYFRV